MKSIASILGGVAIAVLTGCTGAHEPKGRESLEKEFQSEFGFLPDKEVAQISSRTVMIGDTYSRWMRFTYLPANFSNVVSAEFRLATEDDVKPFQPMRWQMDASSSAPNPNAPDWWKLPKTLVGRVYYKENFRKDFPASYAYVWVDESEAMVYSASVAWQ